MEASDLGRLLGYVLPGGHTPSAGGEEDRLSRKKHAGRLDSQKASWLEVSPQGNRSWDYDEQRSSSPHPQTHDNRRDRLPENTFTRTLQRWPWQSQFKGSPLHPTNPKLKAAPPRATSLGSVAPKACGEGVQRGRTRAGARSKFIVLVTGGHQTPGQRSLDRHRGGKNLKTTQITQGAGVGRRLQRSPEASSSLPKCRSLRWLQVSPRVWLEGNSGPLGTWQETGSIN